MSGEPMTDHDFEPVECWVPRPGSGGGVPVERGGYVTAYVEDDSQCDWTPAVLVPRARWEAADKAEVERLRRVLFAIGHDTTDEEVSSWALKEARADD